MSNNIEVELTGPLTKTQFTNLYKFLDGNAKKTGEKQRVLIDYSTFLPGGLENRDKDIRLRITNGAPEIIVKLGKWSGAAQRKELSVFTEKNSFDILVQIFGEMGYKKGILCVRHIHTYEYKDIEFALVEVPNYSFHYEAEIMTNTDNSKSAKSKIEQVCQELKLEIFDQNGYFKYIERLNQEANEVFDYDHYAENYFEDRFHFNAYKK